MGMLGAGRSVVGTVPGRGGPVAGHRSEMARDRL